MIIFVFFTWWINDDFGKTLESIDFLRVRNNAQRFVLQMTFCEKQSFTDSKGRLGCLQEKWRVRQLIQHTQLIPKVISLLFFYNLENEAYMGGGGGGERVIPLIILSRYPILASDVCIGRGREHCTTNNMVSKGNHSIILQFIITWSPLSGPAYKRNFLRLIVHINPLRKRNFENAGI